MKIIGIKENDNYAGFTLTASIQEEYDNYANTPLQVIDLGTATNEEQARNIVDFFTVGGEPFGIDETTVLTAQGQAVWDSLTK